MMLFNILLTIVLFHKLEIVGATKNHFPHGQIHFRGPVDCVDYMDSNEEVEAFNSYPVNPHMDLNFLTYGQTCNFRRELQFREKMKQAFLNSKGNVEGLLAMKKIWNKHRAHAIEGVIFGNRICNPTFLLSCHPTLAQCLCRYDYTISGDLTKQDAHEEIQIVQKELYIEIHTDERFKTFYDVAQVCRVKEDSVCQWEVPWMAFCFLPCEKGSYCIGEDNVHNAYRCRRCNPWDTERYVWDSCKEKIYDENDEEIIEEEEEEFDEEGDKYYGYSAASISMGQKFLVVVLGLILINFND